MNRLCSQWRLRLLRTSSYVQYLAEQVTSSFRGGEEQARLFLAVIPPHNLLLSSSIARWIKKSLGDAGLDRSYTAHSTRSASTTVAAMAGISMKEIMSRAGWSRKDTFSEFYYRPQAVGNYSKAVLQTCKEIRWLNRNPWSTIDKWLRLPWQLNAICDCTKGWRESQHVPTSPAH